MSYLEEGETLLQFVANSTTNTAKICAGGSAKPRYSPTEISTLDFLPNF